MRRNPLRETLLFALALPAACAAPAADEPPASAIPAALNRFADLAQFVSPDMTGFLFREYRDEDGSFLMRALHAGRDCEVPAPTGALIRVIKILDLGPEGNRNDNGVSRDAPNHEIEGVPCWHDPKDKDLEGAILAAWYANVDDRYRLITYDRETMAIALARPGSLHRILAPFGDLRSLPDDSTCFVFNQWRQQHPQFQYPIANGKIIWALLPMPWRIRVVHELPLTSTHESFLERFTSWKSRTTRKSEAGWIEEAELKIHMGSGSRHAGVDLTFDILFGWVMYWI